MPSVFFSYSHIDEALRDQLEKQLAMLKRQGVIETWHDRRIGAGQDIHASIDDHINTDDIILLLVSADFIASDYCYDIEMQRAMERHERNEAIVIPVILRACDWHSAPFGKLNAVPRDGKPITQWTDIDEAMLQVAKAVREASARFMSNPVTEVRSQSPQRPADIDRTGLRSSNMRLTKTFTQREKDQFKLDTFEYIARFFENSLSELGERNRGYEGVFRRIDANRFFATIYRDGKDVARGTVYIGGDVWGRGICYVEGETTASNSTNESLSVESDDQTLYLKSMGMASFGGSREQKLSQEGAAELLWGILIGRLQNSSY
ncbi:toll/interleukin-1 receptor domain-containing protein [Agrobacterium sp. NPDC090283]|uniref:toll/interleukin-1 receptor domain-containing protein n=1 Tax=Agrobacterium sp. NPDC090283 TaxID=3363920 RepID=UPI00383A13DF